MIPETAGTADPVIRYDFWNEEHATHTENGYLLLLLVLILLFDACLVAAIFAVPPPDVYLVPGAQRIGHSRLHWAADTPTVVHGEIAEEVHVIEHESVLDLLEIDRGSEQDHPAAPPAPVGRTQP